MKRIIAFTLIPTAALAHPGDHAHNGVFTNLRHLLTEPDHLAMMAVAVLACGVIYWLRKGRQE